MERRPTSRSMTDPAVLPIVSVERHQDKYNNISTTTDIKKIENTNWGLKLSNSTVVAGGKPLANKDKLPQVISDVQKNLNSLSLEDVIKEVTTRVNKLLPLENFKSSEITEDFTYIRVVSRYGKSREVKLELSTRLSRLNVPELFQKVWRIHFHADDFMTSELKALYSNMIDSLTVLCNLSDKSIPLCTRMYNIGLHQDILSYLLSSRLASLEGIKNLRLRRLTLGLMNLLYDLVQNVVPSWEPLRSSGAVDALQVYRGIGDELVSCKALLLQAYIITEAENERLNSDEKTFKFLLNALDTTLQSPDHYSRRHGFSTIELVSALNRLAANDNNKVRVVETGALPHYVRLLGDDCSLEEQRAACEGLWTLAFQCKDQILAEPDCLSGLQRLVTSSRDEKVRQHARGALWILHSRNQKGPARMPSVFELTAATAAAVYHNHSATAVQQTQQFNQAIAASGTTAAAITKIDIEDISSSSLLQQQLQQQQQQEKQCLTQLHVFISYQWDSKPSVLRLRDRLRQAGYQVWVDVDSMAGSVLEAMAEAVEKAAVVIICLTQKYKESPNCRTEAEYTFRLRKEIVPVRMQAGYTPDGWLGALIGSKLVHDFITTSSTPNSSQQRVSLQQSKALSLQEESFYQGLFRDLGDRGKLSRQTSVTSIPKCDSINEADSADGDVGEELIQIWSYTEVQNWLKEQNLQRFHDWFKELDGSLLLEYQAMRRDAPETFYAMLHKNNFSLADILRLSSALNHLCHT